MTLEERVEYLEKELERVKAINEIQNVMARYEYLHTAQLHERIVELFARDPDVSLGVSAGVFCGPEGIERFFTKFFPFVEGDDHEGFNMVHALTTSVIEVAADGKTAKALWMSPGHETMKNAEGKLQASWAWAYYQCDFIKEDGQWKIWHFWLYPSIKSPYEVSWVDAPYAPPGGKVIPEEYKADKPNDRKLAAAWSATKVPTLDPVYPDPYDTWEE